MKQINNIFAWSLLNRELLYTDKVNRLFCVYSLSNEVPEKYDLNYKPSYFYQLLDNSFIIVDDTNQPSSIYSEKKLLPFDMDHIGCIVVRKQNPRYLVLYKGHMDEKVYKVFDWTENKVKIEFERPFTIVKDKALSIVNWVLHCYSLNGELNWQYNPASSNIGKEKLEIKRIIGIYRHQLWLLLNDESFIVLDVETGKVLLAMNLKEMLGLNGLAIGDMHLDENTGKIRVLAFLYYIEIDLTTHTAEIKKKYEEGWSIGVGRFYEGDVRVYFAADYPMYGKSIGKITAGIFNTETLEIEWYYTLPAEDKYHFFVDQPQANEKYFGVKDTNNVLYLFER